jgi:hypothetical protein
MPVTDWPAEALIDFVSVLPSLLAPRSIRPGAIGSEVVPVKRKLPLLSLLAWRCLPWLSRSMTSAPATGSLLAAMITLPEIDFTVCGWGGALAFTVSENDGVAGSELSGTTRMVMLALASPALSFAFRVSRTVLGEPGGPLNWKFPQPLAQLTPDGRPVRLISPPLSLRSGRMVTLTVASLPALTVTELGLTVASAAEAGVAGTASSAPNTSATTTPARCFQAHRCVDTSTAFRV